MDKEATAVAPTCGQVLDESPATVLIGFDADNAQAKGRDLMAYWLTRLKAARDGLSRK